MLRIVVIIKSLDFKKHKFQNMNIIKCSKSLLLDIIYKNCCLLLSLKVEWRISSQPIQFFIVIVANMLLCQSRYKNSYRSNSFFHNYLKHSTFFKKCRIHTETNVLYYKLQRGRYKHEELV